jgi:methylenetetrahydrofolate dehydrogenase (NADP+)/methenyltetrahydrofolate cyclohydrolase
MIILEGKKVSEEIKGELKVDISKLKKRGVVPGLAVVIVGDDPASIIYVRSKEKSAKELGMNSWVYRLGETVTQEELEQTVANLNQDELVHGIIIQLPLPAHLDAVKIMDRIDPEKDVDCFHPENVGRLTIGMPRFLPCTPAGIIELLKHYGHPVAGKNVTVVGRSNIVGKPLAVMLMNLGATVTVCHTKTRDLKAECLRADILVSAVGHAGLIREDMVKNNIVVVDVGISRTENGKLAGDVDFEAVSRKASAITPVPGGVGPMTIAMLLKNTVKAATQYSNNKNLNKLESP